MNSLFGTYNTISFTDYFKPTEEEQAQGLTSVDKFVNLYNSCGLPTTISTPSAQTLFWLLYASYGNSHIMNFDKKQFELRLFSIVFKYGPAWEKRVQIQKELRDLSIEELQTGSKTIFNHAYNPGTPPGVEELESINEQTTNKNVRGKLDAYSYLWDMLSTDVTSEFINKFGELFIQIVAPQGALLYESEEEE